jgi:predicted Fe-Mo cluster-binding NifX family protein
MVVCIPVSTGGVVGHSWGRASRVAVVRIESGQIASMIEHDVAWDTLHDTGPEGSHHALVARFLKDQGVEMVVAGHMGGPMAHMLQQMGIRVQLGAAGSARSAALAAATTV